MLAVGVMITAGLCEGQRRFNANAHNVIEQDLANDVASAITGKLNAVVTATAATAGYFDGSSAVTRLEFRKFYKGLSLSNDENGVLGLGYAAVVQPSQAQALEAEARRDGIDNFTIRPPSTNPFRSTILYLEPNSWRNQRALGFDMYSEPTRREALLFATTTGQPSLSGPVKLLQEVGHHVQRGALLYIPIYNQPREDLFSDSERQRSIKGWAYSPLRLGDFISSALSTVRHPLFPGTAVLVYDGDLPQVDNLIYDNYGLQGTALLRHPKSQVIRMVNRDWLINVQLGSSQISPQGFDTKLLLLALTGTSLGGIASLLTHILQRNFKEVRVALEQAEQASRERALAAVVFEANPLAILITDPNGIIVSSNLAFGQISGYSRLEIQGRKANILRSGRHDQAFYHNLWSSIIQNGYWSGEIWNRHRNGDIRRHELTISAVLDGNLQITHFVGMLRDITERFTEQEEVRHQALHDALTGLPNRNLLRRQLNQTIALARRKGTKVGLMFMDLDGFKPINDLYGHTTGDLLLQQISHRLQQSLRESDVLARQGGDEFVLLIPDAPDLELLEALARKLQKSLALPFPDMPEGVRVGISIGIARWPDHAEDADGLLNAADGAMYRAKNTSVTHVMLSRRVQLAGEGALEQASAGGDGDHGPSSSFSSRPETDSAGAQPPPESTPGPGPLA